MDPDESRSRSRSPERSHKRRRRHSRSPPPTRRTRPLPLNAGELNKHDLRTYRPMFGLYLDIQKQKDIDELDEGEVKGRWKSFVNKWNRGELAEGWYDPVTLTKAVNAAASTPRASHAHGSKPGRSRRDVQQGFDLQDRKEADDEDEDENDDDYGPSLPDTITQTSTTNKPYAGKSGPSIPRTSDLLALREEGAEAAAAAHEASLAQHRAERKAERRLQAQRLDDLVPRAEAGTRERQLEKKREVAASNRSFAQSAHDAGDVDLKDDDLMGDADSLGQLKRMKRENERKKSERELRREENVRARAAEREEKMAVHRAKEEKTVQMLKELARARFGAPGSDEGAS